MEKLLIQKTWSSLNKEVKNSNTILFTIMQLCIIVISFIAYSSVSYPLLNSDDAVSILMLHDFHLPKDIFFWGQNRVGSIIPLLGQIPYKIIGIDLLWSESITHYLILIIGFLSFSTFFKSNFSKIAFCILWFLPIDPFLGLVRYSFGLQYSFLGLGLYFLKQSEKKVRDKKESSPIKFWVLSFISFLIAIWITESAFVTIAIILFISLIWYYFDNKKIPLSGLIFSIFAIVIGVVIMFFLKNTATVSDYYEYNQQFLNSLPEIIKAIKILFSQILSAFSINNPNPFLFIYSYSCLVLFLSIPLFFTSRNIKKIINWKWILIFTLDGITFIFVNLLSHWSLLNGVARRYFVGVYIVWWISFLIFTEYISNRRTQKTIRIVIFSTLIIGAISIPYGYKYIYPKRLTPKAKIVSEFKQLGKIGIIADYWNSYGTSFVDPYNIKATPHDKSEVRNYSLVDSVFAQPKIYIIKDQWLEDFPQTITQFGNKLTKTGDAFNIGDCNVCEYKLNQFDTTLSLSSFIINNNCIISNDSSYLIAKKDNNSIIYKHIISGPYMTLPAGKYTAKFNLETDNVNSEQSIGVIDVVSDYGNHILSSKQLVFKSLNTVDDSKLEFNLEKVTQNIEFRLYYYGQSDLTFKNIEITKNH